jgi:glycosyltransferase involved in cell wall biosynthesis
MLTRTAACKDLIEIQARADYQLKTSISIITITRNCAHTVVDCLDSLRRQSYEHREQIVIDGVSQDGTLQLLEQHRGQLAVLISEPDKGIYDALNKGIAHASGDVVGFLHADDLYAHPNVLADIAEAFSDPDVCAVYGDLEYVSQDDVRKVIRRWKSKPFNQRDLIWGWMPAHPTLYVRREWYARIGGFDISYKISADYLSILQLFSHHSFKAVYVPEVFVKMRIGGASNKSIRALVCKTKEDWRALRSCGYSLAGTTLAIVWKNLSKAGQFF